MEKRILIADRSGFVRVKLEKVLKEGGYEVVGAAFGFDECLQLAQKFKPDIVITDIFLRETMNDAEKNGVALTKALLKQNPGLSVVFYITTSDSAVCKDALAAGAKGFIERIPLAHPPQRILDELEKALNA